MAAPDDPRVAYLDADPPDPPAVSWVERALLCDTLEQVGPEAPTLSGEWDAHHLVAHLVVREGNPVRSVWAAISRSGDDQVDSLVSSTDFSQLVDEFRAGPPKLSLLKSAKADHHLNTLEFFVHHEDVLRAVEPGARRMLPPWAEDQIWSRLKMLARLTMRHSPVPVALQRTDDPDEPPATASKGPHPVVVDGLPSELTLYAHGRDAVASFELTGRAAAVEKLRAARFGL